MPPPTAPLASAQLMAQEAGLHVDMEGFQVAMEEAKELSRAGAPSCAAIFSAGLRFFGEEETELSRAGAAWRLPAAPFQLFHLHDAMARLHALRGAPPNGS